jgi:hypothetical protein
MIKNPYMKELLVLSVLSILLNACGGGSGGDGSDTGDISDGGDDNPPPVSGNINSGLTGKLYLSDGWVIDIPTGRGKRIPGVMWDEYCLEKESFRVDENHDFHCTTGNPEIDRNSYNSYEGIPNLNGVEYLTTVSTCLYWSGLHDRDCLEIRSMDAGELIGERLIIDSSISGSAKFSRDGQYYAFARYDSEDIFAKTTFTINNRYHEEITSITMQQKSAMPFDWGPSGKIVLAYSGALYVTPPYSLDGIKVFDLRDHPELTNPDPDSGQFAVDGLGPSIRMSPDGTKIAFLLFNSSTLQSAAWIINSDGTDFHKFAHAVGDNEDRFTNLAWSPDGNYILTAEGFHTGHDAETGSHSNYLYVIPSDSRNVALNRQSELSGEGEDDIVVLRTNYKQDDLVVRQVFGTAGVGLWWLPQ